MHLENDIPAGFILLERLGNGSFGRVELVERTSDKRLLALKILQSAAGLSSADTEREALGLVDSPFVTKLHDTYERDDKAYLIIDAALGGSLRQKIQVHKEQSVKFDIEEILNIFTQILLALSVIHEAGIVHRDLSPTNILFAEPNCEGFSRVQIIDFGVSGILSKGPLTGTHGTPSYMSPEIGNGEQHDTKSDIYSLGVILYEMCELKLPSGPGKQTMRNFPKLAELVSKMMSPNPKDRPTADKILSNKHLTEIAATLANAERITLTSDDYKPIEIDFDDLNFDELPPINSTIGSGSGRLLSARGHRSSLQKANAALRQQERQALQRAKGQKSDLKVHELEFHQRMENAKKAKRLINIRDSKGFSSSRPICMTDDEQAADELEKSRMLLEKQIGVEKLCTAYRKLEEDPQLSPAELGITFHEYNSVSRLLKRDKQIYGV